jgi:hypothetical protein
MRDRFMRLLTVLAVLAAVAVGASGVAGGSPSKAKAKPAPQVLRAHTTAKAGVVARSKAGRLARATPARTRTTTGDGDHVQQGDQSGPATPPAQVGEDEAPESKSASESESKSESGIESEQGQPGEPAVGHEDPPGQDVNHECTGDCVE